MFHFQHTKNFLRLFIPGFQSLDIQRLLTIIIQKIWSLAENGCQECPTYRCYLDADAAGCNQHRTNDLPKHDLDLPAFRAGSSLCICARTLGALRVCVCASQ
jgi:hypothetical protein